MNIFVVRAFIRMHTLLPDNRKLAEELKKLTRRLNVHELAVVDVLRLIIINFKIGNQCCPCRPSSERIETTRAQGHALIGSTPRTTHSRKTADRLPSVETGGSRAFHLLKILRNFFGPLSLLREHCRLCLMPWP
jgi:hypothetical protein